MLLHRYLKFSLRTLLLATLCAGSGMLLHRNWAPWVFEKTIESALPQSSNPFKMNVHQRVFFLNNDRLLATNGSNGLGVWDLENNKWLVAKDVAATFVFELHGNDHPLVIWEDRPHFIVHDVLKGETLITLNDWPHSPVQTRDGSLVSMRLRTRDNKDFFEVWDCVKKEKLWTTESAAWLVFSSDGNLAADVDMRHNAVRIYDSRTGAIKHNIPVSEAGMHATLFTPDGATFIAMEMGSTEASVLMAWNTADGKPLSNWQLVARMDSAPAFSPDSKRLATHESDGRVRVWEIATGRQICAFPILKGSNQETFTFTPDGERILLSHASGDVSIFDAQTGQRLLDLFHGQQWIVGKDFDPKLVACGLSAKGDKLACLTYGGDINIWKRIRPEYWWGPAYLPKFWLMFVLAAGLLWSLARDLRASKSHPIR